MSAPGARCPGRGQSLCPEIRRSGVHRRGGRNGAVELTDPVTGEAAGRGAEVRPHQDQDQQCAEARHQGGGWRFLHWQAPMPRSGWRRRRPCSSRATPRRFPHSMKHSPKETDPQGQGRAGACKGLGPACAPDVSAEGQDGSHRRRSPPRGSRRRAAGARRGAQAGGPVAETRQRAISATSRRRSPIGTSRRTSGTASRSARSCCWPPSASPSPSASWASSTWRMARW